MSVRTRAAALACVFACAAASGGCSLNRIAANSAGGMIASGMPAFLTDSDTETARQAMPGALKMVEAAQLSSPRNTELLDTLAQGYCGYAFMFVEDDNPKRASVMYRRGAEFARRSLELKGAADFNGVYPDKVRAHDAPTLFWNAFCRAGYLQLNLDQPDALADLPEIETAARRAAALDSSFYYNGAHSVLGSIAASRPAMLGGDSARAKTEFETALTGDGGLFLANRYMYAKTYAVQNQDAELFESELNAVIGAPQDALPAQALANEVVKAKARKLLEKKNDLF